MMSFFIDEKGKRIKPKLKNGYFNTGDVGDYKKKELFIFEGENTCFASCKID